MFAAQSQVIFLDRDGTLNRDFGYISSPKKIELLSGVASGISNLKKAGFSLVVVSNQSAIGRGVATVADIESCNLRLQELLLESFPDARIDEVLYCPHGPEQNCNCRKPKTGLVEVLLSRTEFLIQDSWMIGDKISDMEFGINAGILANHCILLSSGEGLKTKSEQREKLLKLGVEVRFSEFDQAAEWIMRNK